MKAKFAAMISFVLTLISCLFIWWLSGFNFDHRDGNVASIALVILYCAYLLGVVTFNACERGEE